MRYLKTVRVIEVAGSVPNDGRARIHSKCNLLKPFLRCLG